MRAILTFLPPASVVEAADVNINRHASDAKTPPKPKPPRSKTSRPKPVSSHNRPSLPKHLINIGLSAQSDTDILVYIDESWPNKRDYGVIAGVVWLGPKPDEKKLPLVRQHTRNPSTVVAHLEMLKNCPHAIPFIFRYKPDQMRGLHYEEMLHESLLVLLGWVMPQKVKDFGKEHLGVRIICEAISSHQHGSDQTDFVRGMMSPAAQRDPSRFERWIITGVHWVQKTEASPKNFDETQKFEQGYMGYADMLAYLALPIQEAVTLAEKIRPEEWAECLTISPGLSKFLEDIHSTGKISPETLLDWMSENLESSLAKAALNRLSEQWKEDAEAQARLMDVLDRRYAAKERDLRALDRQFKVARKLVGKLPDSAPRRLRLLDLGVCLQRANHFGNPEDLGELENAYDSLREIAFENGDADLVAHVDLNLAVRAADRFEPDQALFLVEELLTEEPRLSLLSRAKAYSSHGQYLAMTGQHQEARERFDKALELIGKADLSDPEREGEWLQTATYRAINAMDGHQPDAE